MVEFSESFAGVSMYEFSCEIVGDFGLWIVDDLLFVLDLDRNGSAFCVRRSRRNWRTRSR